MMLSTERHVAPITILALLLQLGLSLPTSSGLVLCVASDGHVAVESGGCDRDSAPKDGSCQEIGHAAPCSDTPLGARELVAAKSKRTGDAGAAIALATSPHANEVLVTRVSPRAFAAALAAPSRAQRSAILRL